MNTSMYAVAAQEIHHKGAKAGDDDDDDDDCDCDDDLTCEKRAIKAEVLAADAVSTSPPLFFR